MEQGDSAARERLVAANIRLVVHIARRYARNEADLLDCAQDGMLGLLRAAKRYDWRRGARFSTYAAFPIRQAILESRRELIRVPPKSRRRARIVGEATGQLRAMLDREPSTGEIAAATGLGEPAIHACRTHAAVSHSLDEPLGKDGTPLHDLLAGPDDVPLQVEERERADMFRKALASLPERVRNVLVLRYGLDDNDAHSLAEVGRRLDLTAQSAYRLETDGLQRLARDNRLRALVERAPRRLRALLPFDLGALVAAVKATLPGSASAKLATCAAVVATAIAANQWQPLTLDEPANPTANAPRAVQGGPPGDSPAGRAQANAATGAQASAQAPIAEAAPPKLTTRADRPDGNQPDERDATPVNGSTSQPADSANPPAAHATESPAGADHPLPRQRPLDQPSTPAVPEPATPATLDLAAGLLPSLPATAPEVDLPIEVDGLSPQTPLPDLLDTAGTAPTPPGTPTLPTLP